MMHGEGKKEVDGWELEAEGEGKGRKDIQKMKYRLGTEDH